MNNWNFDLLSPLLQRIHRWLGANYFCAFDNGSPEWAGLKYWLEDRGVRPRWAQILGKEQYCFTVSAGQADYCAHLLDKAHITYVRRGKGHRRAAHGSRAARGPARPGLAARIKSELFN